jgi:PP-loop superfamily ATP-utilizing enzyme
MKKELIKPFASLTLSSIEANAKSCNAQIFEYNFPVSQEQFKKLLKLERDLHELVKEITKS